MCSPALFHFKFWAQWVRKRGAFFPFCSWKSPLRTAVLSDAELDSHPWHYSCSAKDDLSCKWGRKWEVISVCSSKLSFQELCPKGIFLWQVIQKLMAVLLSVSVNQIHCISAIWCVCWPCRALCRCGPSGWNGVRAQAARKTQKLSTRYLANQNLLLCLFNKMEQCVWMEHTSNALYWSSFMDVLISKNFKQNSVH